MTLDMFPEVEVDKVAALRRRTWARHQHTRVVDPNDNERYTLRPTLELCMRLAKAALLDRELDVCLSLPPGDRCEQDWWQKWIEPYRDGRGLIDGKVSMTTHPLPGRQKFGSPGDPAGLVASSAPFPSVLIVWRRAIG